jgi:nucleotide-binding universal stress UspA family protein
LCPIDFSEHSRQALRYAAALAARSDAALMAIYVNDPLLIAAAAAALHDRTLAGRSLEELRAFVTETISRRGPRLTCRAPVGNPSDQILKAAARADVIVLGTHGLTGADRLLLGSTTLSVLQRTAIPVLAVPRREAPLDAPTPSWPGTRILAPVELDSESAKHIDIATRLADWLGAGLLIAHVIDGIAAPRWLRGDLSSHDRLRLSQAKQQVDALVGVAARVVNAEGRVSCGNIADEIASMAANDGIELLVTALRERRGWFGARRGSISYHVLSRAVAPVLAYPPQWRPR